jgi:K+-transporting ATPase ATPase C chain
MRRQLLTGLRMILAMTVLCGLAYPLLVLGASQVAFKDKANGSMVKVNGVEVGSSLLGQRFSRPEYFQPRPSAAGNAGYDPSASSPSNLGPTNEKLITAVDERIIAYRQANGLAADAVVPVDAVTSSGSGLDPHISIANARLQARRVAQARSMSVDAVNAAIDAATVGRIFGILGEPAVNVVELNLALDAATSR